MSVIYKPFLGGGEYSDPEILQEALSDGAGENEDAKETAQEIPDRLPGEPEDDSVIEEREGVHYISQKVLNNDAEKNIQDLDQDFKKLVDSIID
jgi:hypothetical protein